MKNPPTDPNPASSMNVRKNVKYDVSTTEKIAVIHQMGARSGWRMALKNPAPFCS